jgi:hypothetical protein
MKGICLLGFAILMMTGLAGSGAEGMAAENSASPADGTFPQMTATNLADQSLSLPQDFAGERNLLLIAFEREQQKNVDTWIHQMKRFEAIPAFRYYELPTIEKTNSMVRWFINSGMRRGIPDPNARARTITLYIDKAPFCQALNITDEKQIYAILVDRYGRVLWRAAGDFDESKAASLQAFLVSGKQ